ncbi:FAD-dependent monooxygenase [Actinocrispum wychmicini]|uniref:2-polyprenyl-6-methoxyphenol hydroxylase-like FAD-dependent oxidoreductase n=1 Tax=Actinocrispum wychmicini TaxID=1213861 RepID=A0A4R2J4V0_9PSEU|nr:FAD-dependent monooxygenase [Actinocrispum wychmicini]TCO52312.1 2-polyprenyl-6-methoxyphenol hydroxylase-like FAD-dependent oxidoreductase [Actinocrispum wychmicini]
MDIVVAGGGIGGLTTALALHARGMRVTVLEAVGQIKPLGVGINVQPGAIAELTALGLGDALNATGIRTREHLYLDQAGATLWTEARGLDAGHEHPQYSIHRGELQLLLLDAVRERLGPDAVRTGARVRSFEQTDDGVRVVSDVGEFEAAALVGADGLHSAVRARLHPHQARLSAAGTHMWRGLTEMPQGFLDGRTMMLANDEQTTRLVAYPISARHAEQGTALVNWVCLVPAEVGPAGDVDWERPGRIDDVLPYYGHWDLGVLDIRAMLAGSREILYYPMVDRDPLATWGKGRVTLLGDAAHLMYPIGANGASQAIVDAVTLAAELDKGDGVAAALARYEAVRRPVTTEVVLANRKMHNDQRHVAGRSAGDKAAVLRAITSAYRATVENRP